MIVIDVSVVVIDGENASVLLCAIFMKESNFVLSSTS